MQSPKVKDLGVQLEECGGQVPVETDYNQGLNCGAGTEQADVQVTRVECTVCSLGKGPERKQDPKLCLFLL